MQGKYAGKSLLYQFGVEKFGVRNLGENTEVRDKKQKGKKLDLHRATEKTKFKKTKDN